MDSGHEHHYVGVMLNNVAVTVLLSYGEWDQRGCVLIVGPQGEGTGREVF